MRTGFNTGQGGICHSGPGRAGCNKVVQPMCDVTRVATIVRGTAAAAGFTINFNLTRCNFFQAVGARLSTFDAATPTIVRRAEMHQITINGEPQEAGSTNANLAANTTFIGMFSDWDLPDQCACPVSWGIFAQNAFVEQLVFTGQNIDVAAADQEVSLLGNCLSACPPGIELGAPFVGGF